MPPGSRALAFASRWFDPATVHRTFEPLIADWQREWIDAPTSRRLIVQLKGVLSFCVAVIFSTPAILQTHAPQSLTNQIARRIAIATGLGTVVLMEPLVRETEPAWRAGLLMLFAIPGSMVLAFPFAMVTAVDTIRRFHGLEPHVARATVTKLAVVAVTLMVFNHGWVMPAANQAWRETMSRGRFSAPVRGVREVNTLELITSPELSAASVRREINNRASLAVLPVLLLWRRWRALDLPAGRWFSARHTAAATVTMIFAFLMLRFSDRLVENTWGLPAGSGPWVTLALLAMIGMIRVKFAERGMSRA